MKLTNKATRERDESPNIRYLLLNEIAPGRYGIEQIDLKFATEKMALFFSVFLLKLGPLKKETLCYFEVNPLLANVSTVADVVSL